jgi:hypothetical protein
MSARGLSFLENWIQKNVTATDRGGDNMRALVLANHCTAEAAVKGTRPACGFQQSDFRRRPGFHLPWIIKILDFIEGIL